MTTSRVRAATPCDVDAIAKLGAVCNPSPWSARAVREQIDAASGLTLVAESSVGDVVGYVVARVVSDEAEILDVGVDPAARGVGLGRTIVERACALAFTEGADAVHLEVRASNTTAQRLYARLGFVVVGRRRNYYRPNGEDAVCMRLDTVDGG